MLISVLILWRFQQDVELPRGQALGAENTAASHQVRARERVDAMDAVPAFKRIGALIAVFLIVIVYWMIVYQSGSTLTYWANDNTDWNFSGVISNAISVLDYHTDLSAD